MNAFWRSGAVIAALTTLVTTVATRYQNILSDAVLSWVLIAAGAALTSLMLSWGWTQAFKFFFIDDATMLSARRKIYGCAMLSCLLPAVGLGAVLRLLHLTRDATAVYEVIWVIGSFALAGASPWLWKLVFLWLVPWMLAKEKIAPPSGGAP